MGGAERLLLEIAPELHGHVEFLPVVVFEEPRSYEAAYRDAGFDVVTLASKHPLGPTWILTLRRLIERSAPDVIHLHLPYVGALGRLGAMRSRRPIVYTEHSLWSRYRPISRVANALTFGLNDAVIWVSEAVEAGARTSRLPLRSVAISRVIHNGVSAERVLEDAKAQSAAWDDPPLTSPSYGMIGHLRMEKGVDVLLRTALSIRKDIPTARGFVVGTGEDGDSLTELRRHLDAPVQFLGVRGDARGLLDALDVFVAPSRVEGLPVALLEAMALGKPIVATRAGGIPEAIEDGRSGLLVKSGDADELAAAIVRLLRDADLGRRLGAHAREVVEARFSARAMARAYRDTYADALSSSRS